MSASSGPEISNNGLVLLYDIANTQKSWKGAPTTNLLAGTNVASWGGAGSAVTTANAAIAPDGTMTATKIVLGAYSGGDSIGVAVTGVIGQIYTHSAWMRADTNVTAGISIGRVSGNPAVSQSVSLTTTWKRFSVSWTLDTNTGLYSNYYGQNCTIYVWMPQLEANSFATPLVNGTRSNTQALLDATGNNTLTASNLVYASTGTFSFNGTSSKITTATLPYQFLTTGFTLSIVLNYTQTTTNDNVISWGGSAFNITGYAWELRIRGAGAVEFSPGIGPGGSGVPIRTSYTPSAALNGRVVFLDITYVANGMASIYENGILRATNNYSGVGTNAATNALTIGQGTDTYFPGTIHQVKLYNTVLTAAEVQQNFNATRSRYGV